MAGLFRFQDTIQFELMMAKKESVHAWVTFLLFAAVCGLGYLWYNGQFSKSNPEEAKGPTSPFMKTEAEFRGKLTELKMRRYKTQNGIDKLEQFRGENLAKLREMGIDSSEKFLASSNQEVKLAVINLNGWVAQIAKANKELTSYDDAIVNIEAMLDKIKRERIGDSVALSDEESLELQKIILDLNERLNVETNFLEDEALGELLDSQMDSVDKNRK
ncbi:MAG: hypothetical protein ACI87E_004633 [Mariniblastus sp.]